MYDGKLVANRVSFLPTRHHATSTPSQINALEVHQIDPFPLADLPPTKKHETLRPPKFPLIPLPNDPSHPNKFMLLSSIHNLLPLYFLV